MTTDINSSNPAWFCVRTRTKAEHLAAAGLRERHGLEVFCPRIRFRRPTRTGVKWFVEALFPGYLFARFAPREMLKPVLYASHVTGLVKFGGQYAVLPDAVVETLRREVGETELKVFDQPLQPGDTARVVVGPFAGIEAVVKCVLPSRNRVRILLDFLGRAMEVEIGGDALLAPNARPRRPGDAPDAPEKRP